MAIIALTSARGAPGVSTTALALTLHWPRPVVLVEADMAGSSSVLTGYLQASVTHERGLVDVAGAHQRGQLGQQLHAFTYPLPIDEPESSRRFIPGLTQSLQAKGMEAVWTPLASHLSSLDAAGTDVIVDAGRLGAAYGPVPLLMAADATVTLTRTQMPPIAALNAALPALRDTLARAGRSESALSLVTIGDGRPYTGAEIRKSLGVPLLTSIEWAPTTAAVYSDGAPPHRRHARSSLVRDIRTLAEVLHSHTRTSREQLAVDGGPDA